MAPPARTITVALDMSKAFDTINIHTLISDYILVLKALRRKYESLWRKTRLTVHFDMYSESCMDVKTAIRNSKSEILPKKISDCNGDQKKLFKIVDTLLGRNKHTTL